MHSTKSRVKQALTRGGQVAIVVIVIIIIVGGGLGAYYLTRGGGSTSSTSTPGVTTTTSTNGSQTTSTPSGGVPTSLTYWYTNSFQYLDPSVSYYEQDFSVISAAYEPLLFYNGTSSTQVVPWLVSNYTVSSTGTTANFTLRSGITFQDGEPLNSTAVYFTFNRLLAFDGSSPTSHGTQASWIIQQLVNHTLSTFLGGTFTSANINNSVPTLSGTAYANAVLKEDFVQITGPLTFTLHIQNPNSALPYLLAGDWASILAPSWVMTHDVALWAGSSKEGGYTLPNPTLSGNETNMVNQYLQDLASTCNTGATLKGCGYTSLIANSADLAAGSGYAPQAGTGPYQITSFNYGTGAFTMQKSSSYWGGPGGSGTAHIATIQLNYETNQATRETDLKAAAGAGQAATIDLATTNLYDLADKATWNGGAGTLVPNSQWTNLIFFTPAKGYTTLASFFYPFATNVTNPTSGTMYTFQPFADHRIRLAFADAVNMTEINADYNNGLGTVANSVYPPGLPPNGAYNASASLPYSYNPDAAAQLLLSAMESPLTTLHNATGGVKFSGGVTPTTAFGCTSLGSNGQCATPIKQSVVLSVAAGDPVDLAAFNTISNTIDNISTTYNMGLTVSVQVLPLGTLYSQEAAGELYMYFAGWIADYPWVVDFMGPMMAYPGTYTTGDGMNYGYLNSLFAQAQAATGSGNNTGLVKVSQLMDQFTTQNVLYLYTFYTLSFNLFTTNINPASVVQNPALGYALYQDLS